MGHATEAMSKPVHSCRQHNPPDTINEGRDRDWGEGNRGRRKRREWEEGKEVPWQHPGTVSAFVAKRAGIALPDLSLA